MTVACRSCQRPIVWTLTAKGKHAPVDATSCSEWERDTRELISFDGKRHRSHFTICPQAVLWRKR